MIHMVFALVIPFILATHPLDAKEIKESKEAFLTVDNHITVPTIMTEESVKDFVKDYKEKAIPYLITNKKEPFYFVFVSGGGYLEPWRHIKTIINTSVRFEVICLYCLSEAANTFSRINNYKYITTHTKITFHKIRYHWQGTLTQEDSLAVYNKLKEKNSKLIDELSSNLTNITKEKLKDKLKGDWNLTEQEIQKHVPHDGMVKISCSKKLMDKTRKIYNCSQSTNPDCVIEVSECPLLQL